LSDFDGVPTEMLDMPMATGEITEEYINHVRKINDVFYDQIKISDQKAAYIFTFMLAFLVSSAEGKGVFSLVRYLNAPIAAAIFSGLLAAASVYSIFCAILVVLPRRAAKSTSLFWGTWPEHRSVFEEAAQRSDVSYLFHQYLDNADVLSLIARQKYRFVTLAFRGLVCSVVAYVLLLVGS
jgi:hypothetical protein